MIFVPDKNDAAALPLQISGILRQRILSGLYMPGCKLAAIRKLAAEFKVCTVTVGRALDILEKENLIKRIPVKGVFVTDKISGQKRPLTACFAFPEKQLQGCHDMPENDALNAEFYRGLLQGAQEENIKLQFTYFEDNPAPELLAVQLEELRQFDFIIFASSQLNTLQTRIAEFKPVFRLCGSFSAQNNLPPKVFPVDYDREDARKKFFDLFLESGCQSTAAVVGADGKKDRAMNFLQRAVQAGKKTPAEGCWNVDEHNSEVRLQQLQELLRERSFDFIFCDYTDAVRDVYEAAFKEGLVIGRDIMVAGIASGITVSGLLPRFTYFKIPRFEQGIQLMHTASSHIRTGQPLQMELLKVHLVSGHSVAFKKSTKERIYDERQQKIYAY